MNSLLSEVLRRPCQLTIFLVCMLDGHVLCANTHWHVRFGGTVWFWESACVSDQCRVEFHYRFLVPHSSFFISYEETYGNANEGKLYLHEHVLYSYLCELLSPFSL